MKRILTEEQKERRATPQEKLGAYTEAWYRANIEKVILREATQPQTNLQKKAWIAKNIEKIHARENAQRALDLEKDQDKNRKRVRTTAEYRKKFVHNQIRARCSSRIQGTIKRDLGQKSGKTLQLLGCDIEWLQAWLEVQFKPGMSWGNYGPDWHIDHKRPCASFDLSFPAQQKLCFHWTNLQPLWAAENLAKKDRWVA